MDMIIFTKYMKIAIVFQSSAEVGHSAHEWCENIGCRQKLLRGQRESLERHLVTSWRAGPSKVSTHTYGFAGGAQAVSETSEKHSRTCVQQLGA